MTNLIHVALWSAITGPEFFFNFLKFIYMIENFNTNMLPYQRAVSYKYYRQIWVKVFFRWKVWSMNEWTDGCIDDWDFFYRYTECWIRLKLSVFSPSCLRSFLQDLIYDVIRLSWTSLARGPNHNNIVQAWVSVGCVIYQKLFWLDHHARTVCGGQF